MGAAGTSFVCARLNGVRERCECRVYCPTPLLRKRAVRASRTVEVGWEWRVGTRSGFGRSGEPGFFDGAVAVAVPKSRARNARGESAGRGADTVLSRW